MKVWRFPAQDDALRSQWRALAAGNGGARPTRRAWLAGAGAALAAGSAGFLGGVHVGGRRAGLAAIEPAHRWARDLAAPDTPIDELARHAGTFVQVVTEQPGDPMLWDGVERLALACIEGRVTVGERDRHLLGRLLAQVLDHAQAPPRLHRLAGLLR